MSLENDDSGRTVSNRTSTWLNDRRFNFATSPSRIRDNFNNLLSEIGQQATNNQDIAASMSLITGQLENLVQTLQDEQSPELQEQQQLSQSNAGYGQVSQSSQTRTSSGAQVPITPSREGHVQIDMDALMTEDTDNSDSDNDDPSGAPITPPNQDSNATQTPPASNNQLNDEWQHLRQLLFSPEIQRITASLMLFVPFMLIILVKIFLDNIQSLCLLALGVYLFAAADSHLRRYVGARAEGRMSDVFKALFQCGLWLCIAAISFGSFTKHLSFSAPYPSSVTQILWEMLMTNLVIKYLTVILKCLIGSLHPKLMSQSRKGRVLQTIEYSHHLYLYCVPIPLWKAYLSASLAAGGSIGVVTLADALLSILYLVAKCYQLYRKLPPWFSSVKNLGTSSNLGTRVNVKLLSSPHCPICFQDYKTPLKLPCNHIYCEECITIWLEREKTCPMCRKRVIADDNYAKCGSTSWILVLF